MLCNCWEASRAVLILYYYDRSFSHTRPCGCETFLIPWHSCHPIWQVISPNHVRVSSWPWLVLSPGSQLRWILTRRLQVVADWSSYLISRKGIGDLVLISSQCSIITIPFWFSFFLLPELAKNSKTRMTENWAQIKEIRKYYVTKEEIVNSIYSYHWGIHNTSTTQLLCRTTPTPNLPASYLKS